MVDFVLVPGVAEDGKDATGVTPPTGGSGIRGWLSGIFAKLPGLGQKTVAASMSVTVASDQAAVPVNDANVLSALNAIGTSTVPVPVTSNAKTGNYAYASIGAPSITTLAANQIIYSNAFVPTGEAITVQGKLFKTGSISLGTDATCWLECDASGGTNYIPVMGSKRVWSTDLPVGGNFPSFIATWTNMRSGNWRVAVNMGTPTGTASGATGFTMNVIN